MHAPVERDRGDALVEVTAAAPRQRSHRLPTSATTTDEDGQEGALIETRLHRSAQTSAGTPQQPILHGRGLPSRPCRCSQPCCCVVPAGFALSATGPDGGQVLQRHVPGRRAAGLRLSAARVRHAAAARLPGRLSPARDARLALGVPRRDAARRVRGRGDLGAGACGRSSPSCLRPGRTATTTASGRGLGRRGWSSGSSRGSTRSCRRWRRAGSVIAGLSAGGYGAADIGLRHPDLFGAIESWSGYFRPLPDGPFKHASGAMLAANDPRRWSRARAGARARRHALLPLERPGAQPLVPSERDGRSSPASCNGSGSPVDAAPLPVAQGEWRAQVDAGSRWAFPG